MLREDTGSQCGLIQLTAHGPIAVWGANRYGRVRMDGNCRHKRQREGCEEQEFLHVSSLTRLHPTAEQENSCFLFSENEIIGILTFAHS